VPLSSWIFATIEAAIDGVIEPSQEITNHNVSLQEKDATKIVRATIDTRDWAILLVVFKAGIRCNELIALDLEDLDLPGMGLTIKPIAKRSNRIVFLDDETTGVDELVREAARRA
jgi:integrase